jgi:hypothetical protein
MSGTATPTTTTTETENHMTDRTAYIDRLRKLADLLDATPELILPHDVNKGAIKFYPTGAEETATTARLLPSSWKKNDPNASDFDAQYYRLTGMWEGIALTIIEERAAVCTRVQVGTETVTVPAVEAAPEMTVEQPIFEYKCEPLLAKAVAA